MDGTTLTDCLSLAFNLARFMYRHRVGVRGGFEVTSLCILAMVRADSPTGKMFFGQVKGAAKRLALGNR